MPIDRPRMDRRSLMLGALAASAAPAAPAQAASTQAAAGNAMPATARTPLPPGASSRFVQANGVELHYVVVGTGPAVVLLHGWPQTWFCWHETMVRLSKTFTLIAPDLRGIGLSQRTAEGYDKKTLAADIAALIGAVAGGRAHVIGHDMGGKAAYVLAQLHPERVDRLVLADCSLPGTESGDALHGGRWHYGFHMAPNFPEMLTAGRERAYIAAQIRAWSHRKDAVSEAAIDEYARHYATPGGMTAGFDLYRALPADAALVASFDRPLAMPVLALGGRYSVGDQLAASLKGRTTRLESVVMEDAGHFVAEEEPDRFCREVLRFLTA